MNPYDNVGQAALAAFEAQGPVSKLLRTSQMPAFPWPDEDNPILQFLLERALEELDQGTPLDEVLAFIAVHAWFEGAIEASLPARPVSVPPPPRRLNSA